MFQITMYNTSLIQQLVIKTKIQDETDNKSRKVSFSLQTFLIEPQIVSLSYNLSFLGDFNEIKLVPKLIVANIALINKIF